MSDLISLCPKCGAAWPPELRFCPLCGAMRPPAKIWPPPVAALLAPPPLLPAGQLLTGNAVGDVMLGMGVCFAPWPAWIGLNSLFGSSLYGSVFLLVPPVLFFALRPRYPVVSRGLGYGLLMSLILTPILLVLGAILLVLGILSLCKSN